MDRCREIIVEFIHARATARRLYFWYMKESGVVNRRPLCAHRFGTSSKVAKVVLEIEVQ